MAKLNGLYIFVIDEDASYGVNVTEHVVETGVSLTDHVKRNGITLTIRGELVGTSTTSTLTKLRTMHNSGTVCKYVGRLTLPNCLITDLSVTATHEVWGGYEFTMTLKEIRTASTSYTKTKDTGSKTGTQQVTPKSSDQYVYHTVKKGDTVWALVASSKAPYKSLNRPVINGKTYSACNWVMEMNSSAFSREGDFGTLQIGKKIIVGVRTGNSISSVTPNKSSGTNGKGSKNTNVCRLTVQLAGKSDYFGSVIIRYTKDGKTVSETKKEIKTYIVSADVGTEVKVTCTPSPTGKITLIRTSGGSWVKSSNTFTLAKITKETLIGVNFLAK